MHCIASSIIVGILISLFCIHVCVDDVIEKKGLYCGYQWLATKKILASLVHLFYGCP